MKRKNLILTAFLSLLLIASPALGLEYEGVTAIEGVKKVNIAGMQFLKIGQGARAVGMGDSYTAIADDINAIFWNGAGLTHVEKFAYQANYTKWLAGTELYSAAAVFNTHSSRGEVLGISLITQQVEPIEETTIFQPSGTGQFVDVNYMAVGLLYAIKFTDKFSFSAKANYVQEKLYTQKTSTFTIDLGSHFYTGFRSLRVAMSFKNFGPDQKAQGRGILVSNAPDLQHGPGRRSLWRKRRSDLFDAGRRERIPRRFRATLSLWSRTLGPEYGSCARGL